MSNKTHSKEGQIVYFSHGGGPLPILNDPTHESMLTFMKALPEKIHRPEGIIVFSAHWEEDTVTIQSGDDPGIMYDYYGFPKAAYEIKYPAKGSQSLAKKVSEAFDLSNIPYRLDDKRAYDHGSYIPLKMMYPKADIPVIQVSLNHNLDPLTHLNIGKSLRPLLKENILIIGSGFSFHNMRAYDFTGKNAKDERNDAFQDRLIEICCRMGEEDKKESLETWEDLPYARYCHPREEHLLPLHVCVGLSEGVGKTVFDDYIIGKRATAFLWR